MTAPTLQKKKLSFLDRYLAERALIKDRLDSKVL
jgi:hypothetical protein